VTDHTSPEFHTVADVERYAAEHGIALSSSDRAKISAAQRAERERLVELYPPALPPPPSFADRWAVFYPKLLDFVISAGETVLTFAQTVLTALGVPFVLLLLLLVEHQRVVHGIALFEADYALASFAAAALVLLNLVLELLAHHTEHQAGYTPDRETRWSLRIWWQNARYTLGVGSTWHARELSPAARYRRLLRIVTMTILALALVGSMRTVIDDVPGAWYEAIATVLTESDLLAMLTWSGGLLFAAAAVLSAQGLTAYIAARVVEIADLLAQRRADVLAAGQRVDAPYQAEVDRAGAMAALAVVNARLEAGRRRADAKRDREIPASSNGHGHGDFLAMPSMYSADQDA
jgi:hypothetical protein